MLAIIKTGGKQYKIEEGNKLKIEKLVGEVGDKTRKCAVVGDMLELGKYSKRLHKQLGKQLAQAKIKTVIAVGEYAEIVAQGAMEQGMKAAQIHCVKDAISA